MIKIQKEKEYNFGKIKTIRKIQYFPFSKIKVIKQEHDSPFIIAPIDLIEHINNL